MKQLKVALLLICITALSTGCSLFQKEPQLVSKHIPANIPQIYRKPVLPDRPIPVEEYMKMSLSERESYLTDYQVYLYGTIHSCNVQNQRVIEHVDNIDKINAGTGDVGKSKN